MLTYVLKYDSILSRILFDERGRLVMKENLFALGLLIIECFFFYTMSILLNLPLTLIYRYGITWCVISFVFNHYKIQSTLIWDEFKNMGKAFVLFCVLTFVFMYPNLQYFICIVCVGFFMLILSLFTDRTLRIIFRKHLSRKTLIIGVSHSAFRVAKISQSNRFALTQIIGFVEFHNEEIEEELKNEFNEYEDIKIYDYKELDYILNNLKIDQVIISLPNATQEQIDEISQKIFNKVRIIKIQPELKFLMTFNSKIYDYDGELLIATARGKLGVVAHLLKRIIDICAGIAGCLIVVPLYFYVRYKNIKSGDNDPVFFKQERIGQNGKPIYIYKFRSMIPNAEQVLEDLMEKNPEIREEYLTNKKLVNDPRVTKVGAFLRKTSLDEFPQFINVLKGDMSLVGPRPYLPREKEDMDFYYDSIVQCKPGITGMWQANGRSDVGFEDRCKLDDYYYRNWSIGLDFILIYKTIKGVVYGKGAL